MGTNPRASLKNTVFKGKKRDYSGTGRRKGDEEHGDRKKEEKAEQEAAERERITFGQYFEKVYFPTSKVGKKKETTRKETELFKNWIEPVIGQTFMKDVKPFARGDEEMTLSEETRKRKGDVLQGIYLPGDAGRFLISCQEKLATENRFAI